MTLPGWASLSAVVEIHAALEGLAVLFFVALVVFDVLAHLDKKRERILERIALGCFAVAVLAEVGAYPYSRRIDSLSTDASKVTEGKIAALNKEAGDARRAAGEANERASKNEKEAARLNKLAEDERTARVNLQKQLAWREPTDAQLDRIRSRLLLFSGQQFDVTTYPSEPECLNLANRLYAVAIHGGWVLDPQRKYAELHSILSGIQINVSATAAKRVRDAASALASSLNGEGVSATLSVVPAVDNPPRAEVVLVFVGKSPSSLRPVALP